MEIQLSNRKGKRFVAIFKNGTKVHFGSAEGSTFIDHGDVAKRAAYYARHGRSGRENWNDPYTPGSLSRHIAWGEYPSLKRNIAAFREKFNV